MNVLLHKETKHLGNQEQIADVSGKGGEGQKHVSLWNFLEKKKKKHPQKYSQSKEVLTSPQLAPCVPYQ